MGSLTAIIKCRLARRLIKDSTNEVKDVCNSINPIDNVVQNVRSYAKFIPLQNQFWTC